MQNLKKWTFLMGFCLLVSFHCINTQNCPCIDNRVGDSMMDSAKDFCKKSGVFKSNSICWNDAPAGSEPTADTKYYIPYDYYECIPYGKTFLLSRRSCKKPWTLIVSTKGYTSAREYFNPYDGKSCNGTTPAPAPNQCDPPSKFALNNP